MSATTKAALDAAISAHVADEYDGDMVTAWVVVTETTTLDMLDSGEGAMIIEARDLQPDYLTQGLLYTALNVDGTDRD